MTIRHPFVGRCTTELKPRLTLLAPEIIVAVLEGRQPVVITMAGLLVRFPVTRAEAT